MQVSGYIIRECVDKQIRIQPPKLCLVCPVRIASYDSTWAIRHLNENALFTRVSQSYFLSSFTSVMVVYSLRKELPADAGVMDTFSKVKLCLCNALASMVGLVR